MTKIISESSSFSVDTAVKFLDQGKNIVFCTDTVYGLAGDAFNPSAINSIYKIKDRDIIKAIPLMVGNFEQVEMLANHVDHLTNLLIKQFWPGGLTVILPKKDTIPEGLSQLPTIAIRMPDHPFCLKLLNTYGPLAVTSANLSGSEDSITAQDAFNQLSGRIPLLIDGGKSKGGIPSTIIDCSDSNLKIIRQGAISSEEIFSALNNLQ